MERVHGAARAWVGLVQRLRVVAVANGLDFVHGRPEDEVVLLAGLLDDFDVRAVVGAQRARAVEHQLHVAGAAGLRAGGRDLLGQVGGGDDVLGVRTVVVVHEHHAHPVADLRIIVDHRGDLVDEADDRLRPVVARRGLRAEDERRGREVVDGTFLQTVVEVEDRERVEQLALVLVQPLDLHVEHEVHRDVDALALADQRGQLALLFALDGDEPAGERIVDLFVERAKPEQVGQVAGADHAVEQRAQLGVAQAEPAALGDAVGLVVEPLRNQRVPLAEDLALEDLGVDCGDAVGVRGAVDGEVRHVHAPVADDVQRGRILDALLAKLRREPRLDALNDADEGGGDVVEQRHVPDLERFAHDGVVRVAERALRDAERAVERHAVGHQQADQLGDRHRRMGVVELDGVQVGKAVVIRTKARVERAQHILQRRRAEHVLLARAQQLAGAQRVVRVQQLGDVLGDVLLLRRLRIVLPVEQVEVKLVRALALPQAQCADAAVLAVADHRHVVGHGAHFAVLHRHDDAQFVAADAPRVAEPRPVVRQLLLAEVLELLLEQAVAIPQAVAVQRDVVRGGAVEEARGQPPEAAVSERRVLDVLQRGEVDAPLGEQRADVLEHAQRVEVVVHEPADQVFRGEVQRMAAVEAVGGVVRPAGRDAQHDRVGQRLVQLHGGGVLQRDVIAGDDQLVRAGDQILRVERRKLAAVVAAVEDADAARDGVQVLRQHPPKPVAADRAGIVHARFLAEAEQVLHRHDGRAGDRGERRVEQRGQDRVAVRLHAELFARERLDRLAGVRPPAEGGVVVVRAGVDDAVFGVVLRKVDVCVVAVEGELQHLHARIAAELEQALDARADDAQVLGDDLQIRQLAPDAAEQLAIRPELVLAVARGRLAGRDGVVVRKADEMVDAQQVEQFARGAQATDPPGEVCRLVAVPAVERVAPALAVGLKVVRRHAGDADRAAVLVQLEQLRVEPDVGGVLRDVDRHVAHQLDAVRARVVVQRAPLAEEQHLLEQVVADAVLQFFRIAGDGLGLAQADVLIRPFHPRDEVEVLLDCAEQRVIARPRMRTGEGVDLTGHALPRVRVGRAEQLGVLRLDGLEVDLAGVGQRMIRPLGQDAVALEEGNVDHQRVARVGRRALVR